MVTTPQEGTMGSLVDRLKVLVADLANFKIQAHGAHWNVTGPWFAELHGLFGEIYADVEDSIDAVAENIRKLGDYPPARLSLFLALSTLPELPPALSAKELASGLLELNEAVVASLMDAFDQASAERQQGVANFLAERIDQHQKWSWMLTATIS